MPYNTLFPGQEKDEKIIMILRRHFFVFFKTMLVYIILLLLPLLVRYIILNTDIIISEVVRVTLGLTTSLYYIFIITFFFRAWLDHYLDIWVVTSERIVNIEQKGLFSRQISSQRLYRIQDVTAEVKGILPTFLHYGDVYVQSAGTQPYFVFKKIPNPYEVSKKITMLVDWKKENMRKEESEK